MRVKSNLKILPYSLSLVTVVAALAVLFTTSQWQAAEKTNFLVIMGDDVGSFNIVGFRRVL
jgi:hypothetical protein